MTPEQLAELKDNDVLRKRLAKWMARFCFRDTKLEDFHDRLSDDDMKELMIDCVNHCYAFLVILRDQRASASLFDMLKQEDVLVKWNDPEIPRQLVEAAKKVFRRQSEKHRRDPFDCRAPSRVPPRRCAPAYPKPGCREQCKAGLEPNAPVVRGGCDFTVRTAGGMMNTPIRFSDAIRSQVDDQTRSIMKVCEESTAQLALALDQMTEHLVITTHDDIRELHNNHVRAIMASTAAKEVSLNTSLIEAVNKYDFLGYALAARSIVEIVATLRYLLMNKLQPIIHEMTVAGKYDISHVRRLIQEEDVYLRGTRFDWVEFFESGFRPLNERYAEWLNEKKKDKFAKKWKPGRPAPVEQVSTATCLEKWAAVEPGVGVLYDLLCDMVHPNIGSVMSTMVPEGNKIRFRVRHPESEGFKLFRYSFPAFATLTGHEHADSFSMLMDLILPIENEAKS